MGQIILSNVKLWVGGYDMSGKLNAIALNDNPDMLDNTTFGCTAKSRKKGLDVITAALAGFWEIEPDEHFSTLGTPDIPLTVAPDPTEGLIAYSFLSQNVEYSTGGNVGDMLKFNVKSESVGKRMIRGNILENGGTARVASGNSPSLLLNASTTGQYLYGVLYVLSAATEVGDTLDVVIKSDDVTGFSGSPETQLTFAQVKGNVEGGRTYQWATPVDVGAVTDTYWRAEWTIVDAGTDNASFSFVVFMGIAG